MIDKILTMVRKDYRLRSLNAGVYHKLVVHGMNFEINSYEAVGLGRVATMDATGLFGLVKREIVVISPLEKEAAVVTYERVKAFGKDTLMLSTRDVNEQPQNVKEIGRRKKSALFDEMTENYFGEYLSGIKDSKTVDAEERKKEVEGIVDALLEEAGLISDIFMVTYGKKITDKLYYEVLFGVK